MFVNLFGPKNLIFLAIQSFDPEIKNLHIGYWGRRYLLVVKFALSKHGVPAPK
jgi:hypothetical protein